MKQQPQISSWHKKKEIPKNKPIPTKLQPGDMVLIQNHVKGPFDPKYIGDYRVVSLKGNQVEIQPTVGGPTEMKHIKHVKYMCMDVSHSVFLYVIQIFSSTEPIFLEIRQAFASF